MTVNESNSSAHATGLRGALLRIDDGIARGEAAIAVVVLLSMVLVAAAQALLRNLAIRLELDWAHAALAEMEWGDFFLQKATLFIAFLGASLATHGDRHIAIDVLPRISPRRLRLVMRVLVGLATGVTTFYLARVFWASVVNNAAIRSFDYEALVDGQPVHVCDAPAAALTMMERPDIFCLARRGLTSLGVRVETLEGALQLVVPAMLVIIGLRFVLKGSLAAADLLTGTGEADGDDRGRG